MYHIPVWHFFTLITTPVAWTIIIVIALLISVYQYFFTKVEFRYVGTSLPQLYWLLAYVIIIVMVIAVCIVAILTPPPLEVVYGILSLLDVGLPGMWPTYVIYRRWEKRHNQILIRKGWQLLAAQP